MKAVAFAPGHISGFFEPVYHSRDMARTGSRGAGINVSLGALSEVVAENSDKQVFEFYLNDKKIKSPVVHLALNYMLGKSPVHVVVRTEIELPLGQGFGMSSACAISATYALASIMGVSTTEAMKASHFAEVQLRTGLGDVMASCFGGIEIRKEPGLPPWGIIEHIPGGFDLVLCVIGSKLDTKKVLSDPSKANSIVEYGKFCTKKILKNPCVENLFLLSQTFTEKTSLADKQVLNAIKAANNFGMASMCMLGNSVFATGKTNELCQVLSKFGRVFVCSIDSCGARILDG